MGRLAKQRKGNEVMEAIRVKKLKETAIMPTYGSTEAAGADLYAPQVKVTGLAVDDDSFEAICRQLKMEIGGLLELDRVLDDGNIDIHYNCGAGYGIPGVEDGEAVRFLARTEGIVLDPVYTGKAFSLFLRMLREGAFGEEENIIFLHSGGAGGLFAIDLP